MVAMEKENYEYILSGVQLALSSLLILRGMVADPILFKNILQNI
jgi:hypothetical protein